MKTVRQISICFSIMSWGLLEHIGQWRCSVFSIRCHHKSQLLCLISESGPHILQSNTKHTICLHQYTYRLKSVLKWAILVNECSDNLAILCNAFTFAILYFSQFRANMPRAFGPSPFSVRCEREPFPYWLFYVSWVEVRPRIGSTAAKCSAHAETGELGGNVSEVKCENMHILLGGFLF